MRTQRRLFRVAALASVAVAVLSGCAPTGVSRSWAFSYKSLDEALAATQAVVTGTVTASTPVNDDNGNAYLTATFAVEAVVAGDIRPGPVPVQQTVAQPQDPGTPQLLVGSTYLLFLERFSFTSYDPCGAATGMYSVAAWGAWQQQDDASFGWLANLPDELPVHGYPAVLAPADLTTLPDRWASARQGADPPAFCTAATRH